MRIIFLMLLFLPILTFAQKANVFIKVSDAKGQPIKGEAVSKGFERWIEATAINSAGKNNTQLSFTITVKGASADLKKALATGELLLNGQVSVMPLNPSGGSPLLLNTIMMEKIDVSICYESMGCNNVMNAK